MNADYKRAKEMELTNLPRWEKGMDHHPMAERIVRFLAEHDLHDYSDYFCWKVGGDGDNGETLMYQMDTFFEMLDAEKAVGGEWMKENLGIGLGIAVILLAAGISVALNDWAKQKTVACECAKEVQVDE